MVSSYPNQMDCVKGLRQFDPIRHKSVYNIGVQAIHGIEAAYTHYQRLFEDYLTATAGLRFIPPISFRLRPG